MSAFEDALLSKNKNEIIPDKYDWYAPLIGDWDFVFFDTYGRQVKGEWIFRRILEGMAIEDLFICPSRATKEANPQPDGEYGVAIRMYNSERHCYDMTYICSKYTIRLEVNKEQDKIICTVLEDSTSKWVFSEITDTTFVWQNVTVMSNGEWRINSNILAKRKK